jgi:2-phosphoglycolate phosphatase
LLGEKLAIDAAGSFSLTSKVCPDIVSDWALFEYYSIARATFMPQLRAIVFDLDGTLADSYAAIAASVNHVRAHHKLPPLPEAEVRRYVGHGLGHLLACLAPGTDPEANAARYRVHHEKVMLAETRLLPGVADTLAALRRRGLRLAICSNKLRVFSHKLLEHLGIVSHFEAVLGPEDVPHLKPAPDMLQAALARLRVSPDEAVYVGDMVVDVQTARAAGVEIWAVATGSEAADALRAAGPDRLLIKFSEIAEVLEEL